MADARSVRDAVTSVRGRAALILVVLGAMLATADLTTPVLVVALSMGAMAAAVLVSPRLQTTRAFNVLVGVGAGLYGLAYGLGRGTTGAWVVGGLVAAFGALVAVNHLGVAPWSEHDRGR